MSVPTILSLQVGQVQTLEDDRPADGRPRLWTTAFFKQPVAGSVFVGPLGLAGDAQADRKHHGGLDKAILAYAAAHYPHWQQEWGLETLLPGAMGENLTVAHLDETTVCLGDRWQAGQVVLEVSQPRQPCWKMGRRWQRPDLPKRVIQTGRTGWYLRVLQEGELQAGLPLTLLARPYPTWTVARASAVMYERPGRRELLAELANLPPLAQAWREELLSRLASLPVP
jgi:MOSC domain-containing protein YiiM